MIKIIKIIFIIASAHAVSSCGNFSASGQTPFGDFNVEAQK